MNQQIKLPAQQGNKSPVSTIKERTFRKPTGKPSWPVLLLAGREKAGKSYQAALASTSDLIDRTFWVGFGEKDPDEYGAIKGARFEIAEHDGTLTDFTATLRYLASIPAGAKPNLLVIDSASKIWNTLGEKANYLAGRRGSKDRNGEVVVGMDLWNKVTREWLEIMNLVRAHKGPVILTARLDTITVMDDNGKPTKNKTEKIKGQKDLAYDVDAIVEMPSRGVAELTGARSVIFRLPERTVLPDFTVDGLWHKLGLATAEIAHPTYTEPPKQAAEPATDALEAFTDHPADPMERTAAERAEDGAQS